MATQPLSGSEREPVPGASATGKADPDERLEVSVLVRRRAAADLKEMVKNLAAGRQPGTPMGRDEFAARHAADPADLNAIRQFAARHGLFVVQEDAAGRTVVLAGTVAQFNAAFGVDLRRFEHGGGTYRGRTGAIHLPDELHGVVEAVLGLDNRPQAMPRFRMRNPLANVRWHAAAGATSYTPPDVAALYGFPGGSGAGECIALIELGGGYRQADLRDYFARLGIAPPAVTAVSVDHGRNHPTGDPNGPDAEVMLDIEVAGSIAPKARIGVFFAPNTDAGFLNAITTAIHDPTNRPSVVSISWGGPESSWTKQALTAFDDAFQAAAAMGVTVCAAAGDGGSSDGVDDGADHVDFPASSPHCLGCGGTRLRASGSAIASETVWNDGVSGGAGGVSAVFALPAWQNGLHATTTQGKTELLPMRGVPDVAGDADPDSGYDVRVDGSSAVIGGTSAVAPLWAGLIARVNAARGNPVGFVNPQLYADPSALRDITKGNNGDFAASAGWDACTGLGSPNGAKVAEALAGGSSASVD